MKKSIDIGEQIEVLIPDVPLESRGVDRLCTIVAALNARIDALEGELRSTNEVVRQLSDIHP